MGLNFFENEQCVSRVEEFGVIDPPKDKSTAKKTCDISYDNDKKDDWDISVLSNNRDDIFFNAIDGNIEFFRSWKPNEKHRACDAMIHTADTIIFIEIKKWRNDSIEKNGRDVHFIDDAIEQLENTIIHFCTAHPDKKFDNKYAYVSNKYKDKPKFPITHKQKMACFQDNTNGFKLRVASEISL